MSHDPRCPWKPQVIGHAGDAQAATPAVACQCPLIEQVRTDEAADCASHEQAVRDQAIRDCIAAVAELKPLLTQSKYKGGYDCCGCSTIDDLYCDSIDAMRALLEGEK